MKNLIKAIQIINPKAEFSIDADLKITWLGATEPILQEEIDQKIDQAKYEIGIEQLRAERNAKLAETDFFALSDLTLSDEMRSYRQKLRDITQDLVNESDVNSVVWPIKPS